MISILLTHGAGTDANSQFLIELEFACEKPAPIDMGVDVLASFTLDFWRVRTGQPGHERQQPLALRVCRIIVQPHGEPTDRA